MSSGFSHTDIVDFLHFFSFCFFLQLGGLNSLLNMGYCSSLGLVSSKPTLILGMDVSHGSPGQADMPSIAAVTH